MKNKLVKRLAIFAVAAVMTFSVAACGNKAEETAAPETTTEEAPVAEEPVAEEPVAEEPVVEEPAAEEAPVSATALTEEEYIAKVTELGTSMTTVMTDAQTKLAELDAADVEGAAALIEELKAPFVEFAAVEAPAAYADAQAKFKSGCEAMIEYLDVCVEMMTASAEGKEADVTELTTKLTTLLTTIQTDFTDAAALMPASAMGTDAAATDAAATDAEATDAAATEAEATDAAATDDAAATKTDKAN